PTSESSTSRGQDLRPDDDRMTEETGLTKQALLTAAACAAFVIAGPAFGQSAAHSADKPDLSGIWRAMNTANWDLEAHAAAPGPVPELGALLAIPPGPGVVVGGTIPYLPSALPQREENRKNRWTADPELK